MVCKSGGAGSEPSGATEIAGVVVTTGGCIGVTGGGWGVGVVTGWADELDWDEAAGRGIT